MSSSGSSSASSSSSSDSSRNSTPEPSLKRKLAEHDSEPETTSAPAVDEPVLSHAQRRKEKKKASKPVSDNPDEPSAKKRKTEHKDKQDLPPRKHSVWVGNLAFKTTEENLRTFFAKAGTVTRVNLPTKPKLGAAPVENRGFAYVDFASPEEQQAAIALSEQPLTGRKLLIKDGADFKGRPDKTSSTTEGSGTHTKTQQKIMAAQKQPPGPTLYFGNLSFNTTADSLKTLLESHLSPSKPKEKPESDDEPAEEANVIRRVRLGEFEDSGKCKGFGFVDFSTTEAATQVLLNPRNHKLGGRELVVEYASVSAVQRGASKTKPQKGAAPPNPSGRRAPRSIRLEKKAAKETGEKRKRGDDQDEGDDQQIYDKKPRFTPGRGKQGGKDQEPARERKPHGGKGSRPKPGAALALAKRETFAIVESKGKKVTFD